MGIWLARVMMKASNSNAKPLSRLPQGTETALTPHLARYIPRGGQPQGHPEEFQGSHAMLLSEKVGL